MKNRLRNQVIQEFFLQKLLSSKFKLTCQFSERSWVKLILELSIASNPTTHAGSETSRILYKALTCDGDNEGNSCGGEQDAYKNVLELLDNALPERLLRLSCQLVRAVLLQSLFRLFRSQSLLQICIVCLDNLSYALLMACELFSVHLGDQILRDLLLLLLSFEFVTHLWRESCYL